MTVQSSEFQFQIESAGLSRLGQVGEILTWLASHGRLDVDRITAIVSARSNFLLDRLSEPGASLANISCDLDGGDDADTLTELVSLFGWCVDSLDQVEVEGMHALTADDLVAARTIGGAIKPIVWAERRPLAIGAFVGPAFLSIGDPLAAVNGAQTGIRLDGKHVSNLFFSGPGASTEPTARTLMRDAPPRGLRRSTPPAPITPWFTRVTFPGLVPTDDTVKRLVGAAGLEVEQVAPGSAGRSRWITSRPHSR